MTDSRAAAAAQGRGKAGREEARSAEAGRGEKPKEEPKPVEKKPEPAKVDPIAEAIKKEEKKPPPKPVAAGRQAAGAEAEDEERTSTSRRSRRCSTSAIPSRQAVTGDTLNSNAALGLAKGTAADNSATWGSMFQRQVERCWKKPYGGIEAQKPEVAFAIRLKRDGTLEGMPVPEGTPATPYLRVYQESALARDHRMPAVQAAGGVLRGMEIFRAGVHRNDRPERSVAPLAIAT